MDTVPAVRAFPATLILGLVMMTGLPAAATRGDLYGRSTRYCTSTYSPGHDTPRGFGPPIDINASGGDFGRPVFAPDDGTVKVFSRTGIYGKSLVWRGAERDERIHVAHLSGFVRRGEVRAGQLIARAGNTGHSFGEGHLHVARQVRGRPAALELSGRHVAPFHCYVSRGPLDRHRRPR